ncbi:ABC transporter substrate-binding protein [Caldinitratiruptor microaerophilus]|uniref:ABC transporter substrate-binding protein n=1 Tax=Caldinitratiruptor microaerophilus TaxID=671077 RepID=A0AA35G8B7_9FIRM|nr:cobalamin-binding protein [Caldinitratiruptor microaerophilus]BDG59104.1 ABC transporter substrate-binding protein [Caldinitratiruptor microaerophilus]
MPEGMRRKSVALLAVLVAVLALVTACSGPPRPSGKDGTSGAAAQETTGAPGGGAAAEAARTSYPLTVQDDAGRTVTIRSRPERILSLAPSNTEILFAVGAGDRVVGRTDYCDYPPEAQKVPSVGGIVDPNVEKMVSLKPDVVFMIGGSEPLRQKLEGDLGMTAVVLDPKTLDEVYAKIRLVGRIVDKTAEAEQVVARMQERVAAIEARVRDIPPSERPTVFYEVWPDPLMTAGPGSFIDDLIRRAGGVNVAADAGQPWAQYSLEAVIKHDPAVILTPSAESGKALKDRARPGWEKIRAVREGRVYVLPDQNVVSRPGPRLVDGLEQIARLLHPDRFPQG